MEIDDYLTTKEAGEVLGRTPSAVRNYIRFFGLPATRRGHQSFIRRDDLETWRIVPANAAMMRTGEVVNANRGAKTTI